MKEILFCLALITDASHPIETKQVVACKYTYEQCIKIYDQMNSRFFSNPYTCLPMEGK